MKNSLLRLIGQIDEIKTYFYKSSFVRGFPQLDKIYDVPAFSVWKQEILLELQEIHDRSKDQFIWETLVNLKQKFNGWTDVASYNELTGSLLAIQKNINKYYPNEIQIIKEFEEVPYMMQKNPKVFISHSSLDKDYASALVGLLDDIGLTEQQIFCSSVSGYGIPLGQDIYEFLKQQFENHSLHIILVLSNNYYGSVACMNEMGAAWILQNRYTTIMLPGFEFKEIKGAINPRQIGLKLDNELTDVKEKLGQLKDCLLEEFGLTPITDVRWEQKRDAFINCISTQNPKQQLSEKALALLQAACADYSGTIITTITFDGLSICVGKTEFIPSQERREIAKWEGALDELLALTLIQVKGTKGEFYAVTSNGYSYIEAYNTVASFNSKG